MKNIHPTAIMHPDTIIEEGVAIGPYAIIGEGVKLGRNAAVGPHAVIEYADIGEECKIHAHAFIGTPPQDLKFEGERTKVRVGRGTVVRECVTINRGTKARGETTVGANCLLMAYSHVAHDCSLGNNVIMANSATLAGHVDIGDNAVLGGLVAIHQFTRIGRYAMLGGGAMVAMDVPPFCMAQGDRARLVGLNITGLKRNGFSIDTIIAIKNAYKKIFLSGLLLKDAINKIMVANSHPEVQELIKFLQESKRGFTRSKEREQNND